MLKQAIPVLHMTRADAAEAFYCRLLGFQLDFEVPASETTRDPCYLGIVRDGVPLHLSSHAGDGVVGSAAYLIVDDVDLLHAEFVRNNVSIQVAPVDQTWGMREMYVKDPDGNSIRFGCRPANAHRGRTQQPPGGVP